MKKIFFIIAIALLTSHVSPVRAQNEISPGAIKALYNYKFAQNMEWPNEDTIKTFTFGVLSSDAEILEGFKVLNGKTIKSKPLVIKTFKKPSAVTGVHLLYVGNEYNSQISTIFNGIMGNNKTLFVTDNLDDKKSVMLNLVSEGT
ncbi:MAG: YfiR family protein, partial [Cytophagales bacterium]|nr:YfiR family protein [Cytophagales bacterium]